MGGREGAPKKKEEGRKLGLNESDSLVGEIQVRKNLDSGSTGRQQPKGEET